MGPSPLPRFLARRLWPSHDVQSDGLMRVAAEVAYPRAGTIHAMQGLLASARLSVQAQPFGRAADQISATDPPSTWWPGERAGGALKGGDAMGRNLAIIGAGALIAAATRPAIKPPVRAFLIMALLFLIISPAKAGSEVSTRDMLNSYDKGASIAVAYLQGLRQGLEWANALNNTTHQRPLYCSPPKIALTLDQYVSVTKDYLRKRPELNEQPVGLTMLLAAEEAFPCRE